MIRSPLTWVGGKSRLRDVIVGLIPAHVCYVEVFGGAAWVLFGKPLETSKSEILNDLDGELANFWRVIKHRSAEFTEAVSWLMRPRRAGPSPRRTAPAKAARSGAPCSSTTCCG